MPDSEYPLDRRAVYLVILLFGIVSLFGDIIYEGARSVTGPYLYLLGGTALVVGVVAGLGEFLGYALRLASGHLADTTRRYWALTFLGYGMLIAVPLLALAGSWEVAALLFLAERMGKGIRAPAKDAILSSVTVQVGRGWGFGIHEALDQIGAIIGPLIFSAAFLMRGEYRSGFAFLAIPFLLMIVALLITRARVPEPTRAELACPPARTPPPTGTLLPYGIFTALTMAGFVAFPLIAFHFTAAGVVSDVEIPLFYSIAMAVDAVAALVAGRLYDRIGLSILLAAPVISLLIPLLVFGSSYGAALLGAVLWGGVMGIHETVLRAAVADYTHLSQRGRAYGVFNTVYGAAWLAGSVFFGWAYGISVTMVIGFAVVMQLLAIPVFLHAKRTLAGV
jgi:MFS family permease